jgi:Bardet-Biedl syndrome 1 protein
LSALSQTFLSVGLEEQKKLLEKTRGGEMKQLNYVTCMTKINKSIDEDKSTSQLVLGAENKTILILDPSGMKVQTQLKIDSVPTQILTEGLLDNDYKIYVVCRDGKVYETNNNASGIVSLFIDLPSKAMGIAKLDRVLAVACMDNSIHGFFSKGKKSFSLYMPCSIISIELLQLRYAQQIRALLIALSNGEIRLYNDKHLVYTIKGGVRFRF